MAASRLAPFPIDAVRHFNRFYTRKIGVLSQGLLDTPFSLTEARVLYELAHRPGLTATALGADLGLDAGYLSRLLARFAQKRLLTRQRSRADARVSALRLTALGKKTFAALNARSAAQIGDLLAHLSAPAQHHLAAHLRAAERLLTPIGHPPPTVVLRAPRPGDFGWVIQRHGVLYAEEYNWDATFESLVARIVADYVEQHDSVRESAWIAEIKGDPVGSIFLVRATATTAKLRLLLVEPSARGAGVGRQLVAAAIAFARRAGYKKITLWTNSILHAARALYTKAGFQLVHSEPHRSFGHDLTSETWELALT
jgi:DNA-binding MarR family transcriptional regulator/GNAT superfamily N-acetyltransferase